MSRTKKRLQSVLIVPNRAINSRQKDLRQQIQACDPQRLLIESDWHSAEGLGARCWEILGIIVETLGSKLVPEEIDSSDQCRYAAKCFHDNWLRFTGEL